MSFWFYSVTMFLVLQLTSYQKLVLCEPQMDDHFEGQRAYKPPPRPWPGKIAKFTSISYNTQYNSI